VAPADASMHLVGWLPAGVDDEAASQRAAAQGTVAAPLSAFTLVGRLPPALVLGCMPSTNAQSIGASADWAKRCCLMMQLVGEQYVPMETMTLAARCNLLQRL
jgi:DNA-binding transcriptional MocR family regulator